MSQGLSNYQNPQPGWYLMKLEFFHRVVCHTNIMTVNLKKFQILEGLAQ